VLNYVENMISCHY